MLLVTIYEFAYPRNLAVGFLLTLYQLIDFKKIRTYRAGLAKRSAKLTVGLAVLYVGLTIAPSRGVWVVVVSPDRAVGVGLTGFGDGGSSV